ncbi:EAL domain-containing protein [Pseudomonas sp. CFBP 8770]|uniref:putative bifunctional diguanylate cyclase/phosphodiesterase n=1 Tax=unclassified Pseudomonas TaxID=196821 RepID=UPI001780E8E0|nr:MULTISPECIES: GGDEF domain-containing phosphodiesterase [unclassified Pseudomonas]MBD8474132.1 EAL domain-containing protein [Pseudomonas sp. CFBP 8773]MBD8647262.1 EAL domain-containing protein [Pseudomonas sp. CFBP 8770]
MNVVDAANPSRYSRRARLLVLAFVLPILASVLIAGGAVLGVPGSVDRAGNPSAETVAADSVSGERDLGENSGRPLISLEDTGTGLPLQTPPPGSEPLWAMSPSTIAALLLVVLIVSGGLLLRTLRSLRDIDQDHARLQNEHRALQSSEERLRDLTSASSDWIWETDEFLRVSYLSSEFTASTGFADDAWLGQPIELLLQCETLPPGQWLQQLGNTSAAAGAGQLRCSYRDSAGQMRHSRIAARPIVRESRVVGYRGTLVDITDQVSAQAQLAHRSTHDAVTGLGDEHALTRFLDQTLADRLRPLPLTLLLLDLEGFDELQESLDKPARECVLRTVASRLRDSTRSNDLVTRLHAGQFMLVLASIDEMIEIEHFCQRLINNIQRPIVHGIKQLQVGVNIGVVHEQPARGDANEWIRCADVALRQAKARGVGSWQHFAPALDRQNQLRQLENDLASAIRHEQLLLHFQPRFSADADQVVAVEALLRWQHPVEGLLTSDVFLPLAERSDLIVAIGRWMLGEACKAARHWPQSIAVSLSLAPAHFSRGDVARDVRDALADARLPASRLQVQVAEQVMLGCADGAVGALTALKELGTGLILDEFGSGYCSLGYLRLYPFNGLKIERRFVAGMADNAQDRAMVRGMIDLGEAMGVRVIGAGVDTVQRLLGLQHERCVELQGDHLSKALDQATLGPLLKQQSAARKSHSLPQAGEYS